MKTAPFQVKIPDPEFTCVAENLLETWQKANQTFKKIEYTMQLKIEDKTYLASSNQKKSAKQVRIHFSHIWFVNCRTKPLLLHFLLLFHSAE